MYEKLIQLLLITLLPKVRLYAQSSGLDFMSGADSLRPQLTKDGWSLTVLDLTVGADSEIKTLCTLDEILSKCLDKAGALGQPLNLVEEHSYRGECVCVYRKAIRRLMAESLIDISNAIRSLDEVAQMTEVTAKDAADLERLIRHVAGE